MAQPNRRHTERGNMLQDLCRALETLRRQLGLDALALADSEGLLVAGAGRFAECERLGALASVGRAPSFTFQCETQAMHLCPSAPVDRATMTGLLAACQRILTGRRLALLD